MITQTFLDTEGLLVRFNLDETADKIVSVNFTNTTGNNKTLTIDVGGTEYKTVLANNSQDKTTILNIQADWMFEDIDVVSSFGYIKIT